MRFFFLFFAFIFSDSEISFRSEPNFLPPPATFIVVAAIGGAALPGKPSTRTTALPPVSARQCRGHPAALPTIPTGTTQ